MKTSRWMWLGLLIVHLLFLAPLFKPGFYRSHDGENHLARFAAYKQAFADGHFPPRWAENLNFGYGTPVFNFFYPLPGYVGGLLSLFGIDYETAFKVLIGLSFVASGLGMYAWLTRRLDGLSAAIGGLSYGLAPYHFLNLYVRGDVGESLALALLPWIFVSLESSRLEKSVSGVFRTGILWSLLILSHNGVALISTPVILLYAVFIRKVPWSLLVALGVSAFFWLPAVYEQQYVQASRFIGIFYKDHFPSLPQLVSSPWGFGSDVNLPGGLSPQVGPLAFGAVIVAVLLVLFGRTNTHRKQIIFWLFLFGGMTFLTLSVSSTLWRSVPFLSMLQFPWRLAAMTSFAASVILGLTLASLRKRWLSILFFIAIVLLSIPKVAISEQIHFPNSYYEKFNGSTYYHGEAATVWSAGDPGSYPPTDAAITQGEGLITPTKRTTVRHQYTIDAKTTLKVVDYTLYYPGWRVYVDGTKVPVEFQNPLFRGLITFPVPPGLHTVVVQFGETPVRVLANIISILTLGISMFFL